jgi:hypothetical protein
MRSAACTWAVAALLALPCAADSFRCGSRLVAEGDFADDVIARCGEPTTVTSRSLWRPPFIWVDGYRRRVAGGDILVTVETWTFDLGPGKLRQQVEVEDGRVTKVQTLGTRSP